MNINKTSDLNSSSLTGMNSNQLNEVKNMKTIIIDIATGNVTKSNFESVTKKSRSTKFDKAFLAELNREELFIGALGEALLDESDNASKLSATTVETKNIYGRTVKIVKTYSDNSVQEFRVSAIKKTRHELNKATFIYKTVRFSTGDNSPVVESDDSKTLANQIASVYKVNKPVKLDMVARYNLAKFQGDLAFFEDRRQAIL